MLSTLAPEEIKGVLLGDFLLGPPVAPRRPGPPQTDNVLLVYSVADGSVVSRVPIGYVGRAGSLGFAADGSRRDELAIRQPGRRTKLVRLPGHRPEDGRSSGGPDCRSVRSSSRRTAGCWPGPATRPSSWGTSPGTPRPPGSAFVPACTRWPSHPTADGCSPRVRISRSANGPCPGSTIESVQKPPSGGAGRSRGASAPRAMTRPRPSPPLDHPPGRNPAAAGLRPGGMDETIRCVVRLSDTGGLTLPGYVRSPPDGGSKSFRN